MAADQELYQRIARKDQEAMSKVYDQYSAALLGVILRIVRSRELAHDLLQDTFVKIWNKGTSYDPAKGSYYTWMLNIARNTALDVVRSAPHKFRSKIQGMENPVTEYSGLQQELNVDHIGLDKVISALDEKHRMVIDLVYFEGYTHQEVHDATGIPLGTVKTRLRLALKSLRQQMGIPAIAVLVYALLRLAQMF